MKTTETSLEIKGQNEVPSQPPEACNPTEPSPAELPCQMSPRKRSSCKCTISTAGRSWTVGMGMAVSGSRSSVRPQGGARTSLLRAGETQHPRAGAGWGHQAHRWEGPGLTQTRHQSRSLPLSIAEIWGWTVLCGGSPGHCVVLSKAWPPTLSMSVAFPL